MRQGAFIAIRDVDPRPLQAFGGVDRADYNLAVVFAVVLCLFVNAQLKYQILNGHIVLLKENLKQELETVDVLQLLYDSFRFPLVLVSDELTVIENADEFL